MRTLIQYLDTGRSELTESPVPRPLGRSVLVETRATIVSVGTERMLVEFGRASLLEKARQQPDRVRQVLEKARVDGVGPTLDAVRSKLAAPIALGYCQAGVVVECGADGPFAPGDRVVTNGNHAEYVTVPYTLTARIPDGVSFESAAFTPLAAIGLQGVRLAEPTLGETFVVYGLGIIGQLTVQILRANGCRVIGIDRDAARLALAERFGATPVDGSSGDTAQKVLALTGGTGADAVLLTLASDSDDPVHQAAAMSRKRGRIVLVGVTGLDLRRDDFYRKELSFAVSCSYGPGRYDPAYEEHAQDYPLPFVRWTEQRNFDAVLQLMAEGRVDPAPLITHRFAFDEAPKAYDLIASSEPSLGVVLTYADRGGAAITAAERMRPVGGAARAAVSRAGTPFTVGVIGAGNFGTRTLIPAIAAAGGRLRVVASGRGLSAAVAAQRSGFEMAATDVDAILADAAVDTLVILTRHDSHADLARRGLAAGKHVFVEKPLALTHEELAQVREAAERSDRILTVGFNRRFAPLAERLHRELAARGGPASLILTVNAGRIPRDHWTQDPAVGGGRIVGEACHFVDLARKLVGAPIVHAHATAAGNGAGGTIDDIAHLSLAFADGSTAVVHYLANGHAGFPKERIEAFADGRVWQIDNWRRLHSWGGGSDVGNFLSGQDKGHKAELAALAAAVRGGGAPPIPYDELFEVSDWAIRLALDARSRAGK
jgi:predicted dehydrogenase/threonine dehydrogenase-like Zn-dependent dehydrogenase